MVGNEWVSCGRIGRAVGLKGECAVHWNSGESPVEVGGEVFVSSDDGTSHKSYRVSALRSQGRFDVVLFEGISNRTEAEKLRGLELEIPAASLPNLEEGQYYCYQILGLLVVTEEGQELGRIVRIFTAGESDVYEIEPNGRGKGNGLLIPAIADVIREIDLEKGRVTISPLKGMLD